MDTSYCTSGFLYSKNTKLFPKSISYLSHVDTKSCMHQDCHMVKHTVTIICTDRADDRAKSRIHNNSSPKVLVKMAAYFGWATFFIEKTRGTSQSLWRPCWHITLYILYILCTMVCVLQRGITLFQEKVLPTQTWFILHLPTI